MADHTRVIAHLDVNCFYAQCHMIDNPELRNVPFGVYQKYLMVTCNYVARDRGVKKMSAIAEARAVCPEIKLVCGEDLTPYRAASVKLAEALSEYSRQVENLGLEEFFVDISGLVTQRLRTQPLSQATKFGGYVLHGDEELSGDSVELVEAACFQKGCNCVERLKMGSIVLQEIRDKLWHLHQFETCGGVAHNKLLAKLVSGNRKPRAQTTLLPSAIHSKLHKLQAGDLIGCGWVTKRRLNDDFGVVTRDQLLSLSLPTLIAAFGKSQGTLLFNIARGIDDTAVETMQPPKSISTEDSFRHCSTFADANRRMVDLINQLVDRTVDDMQTYLRIPTTVKVSARHAGSSPVHSRHSKQGSLPSKLFLSHRDAPKVIKAELLKLASQLLKQLLGDQPFNLVLLNVAVNNFVPCKLTTDTLFPISVPNQIVNLSRVDSVGIDLDSAVETPQIDEELLEEDYDTYSTQPPEIWHCLQCNEDIPPFAREAHELFHKAE